MSDGEGYDDAIGGKLQLKFGANAVVKADKKSKKKARRRAACAHDWLTART